MTPPGKSDNPARRAASVILEEILTARGRRPAPEVVAKAVTALAYAAIYIGDAIDGGR